MGSGFNDETINDVFEGIIAVWFLHNKEWSALAQDAHVLLEDFLYWGVSIFLWSQEQDLAVQVCE